MSTSLHKMPFWSNTDEVAHMIVVQTHAHRQKFVAAFSNTTTCAVIGPQEQPPHPAPVFHSGVVTWAITPATASAVLPDEAKAVEPPKFAEFLLRMCATSIHDDAEWGCMTEIFANNCTKLGNARATRLYRADALGYLLRQIPRMLKWAALIKGFKRLIG